MDWSALLCRLLVHFHMAHWNPLIAGTGYTPLYATWPHLVPIHFLEMGQLRLHGFQKHQGFKPTFFWAGVLVQALMQVKHNRMPHVTVFFLATYECLFHHLQRLTTWDHGYIVSILCTYGTTRISNVCILQLHSSESPNSTLASLIPHGLPLSQTLL